MFLSDIIHRVRVTQLVSGSSKPLTHPYTQGSHMLRHAASLWQRRLCGCRGRRSALGGAAGGGGGGTVLCASLLGLGSEDSPVRTDDRNQAMLSAPSRLDRPGEDPEAAEAAVRRSYEDRESLGWQQRIRIMWRFDQVRWTQRR